MKKLIGLTMAIALLCIFTVVQAEDAGEAKWFDMENCEMCKCISAEEGLMENMTWEQHKIKSGILSVCNVAADFQAKYETANAKMESTGEKLMAGEKLDMCGSCMALGSLFPKGLNHEKVKTADGGIMLFSSADPAVVTELHAWADKNAEEMAKMMSAMEAGQEGHEGHNH